MVHQGQLNISTGAAFSSIFNYLRSQKQCAMKIPLTPYPLLVLQGRKPHSNRNTIYNYAGTVNIF